MSVSRPITFTTRTVRVPESGIVRLPGRYPHEFASMPSDWREISGVTSKYVDYPTLDPASLRELWRSTDVNPCVHGPDCDCWDCD